MGDTERDGGGAGKGGLDETRGNYRGIREGGFMRKGRGTLTFTFN